MRRSLEAYAAAARAFSDRRSFFRRSFDVGRTNHTSHLCPLGSTKFRKLILLHRPLFDVLTYSQDSCPIKRSRPQIFKKIHGSELAARSASLLHFRKHLHHFPTTQKRNRLL